MYNEFLSVSVSHKINSAAQSEQYMVKIDCFLRFCHPSFMFAISNNNLYSIVQVVFVIFMIF